MRFDAASFESRYAYDRRSESPLSARTCLISSSDFLPKLRIFMISSSVRSSSSETFEMPARLRQLNERTDRLSVSTGMSHSFGGASGSGSARLVKPTKRSSCSCMIAADVESASSGVIEPLVSISSVRRSKSTLWPTRVSSTDEVDLANRREDRVERNQPDHVLDVALLVGHHVAAALLDADLHRELRVFRRERREAVARIEDLDVGIRRDVGRGHVARAADDREVEHARLVAVELDRQALEVEHQRDRVFDHPGDRRELVQHAVDLHVGDGSARNRAEQNAAQRVAERDAEAALERFDHELGIVLAALANFDGCAGGRFQHGHEWYRLFLCCRLRYPPDLPTTDDRTPSGGCVC